MPRVDQPIKPIAPSSQSETYLPALDGLRALAVLAVLLYHADLGWVQGGLIGVEIFFVISGFLITWLLLREFDATGQIALGRFWLRRAQRLLPATFVLIIATLVYAVTFLPGEVARLRGDALAACFYLTNWYLIYGRRSYFETTGRPSLLQHLWSLAVEGQCYLVWPPIVAGVLRRRSWLLAGTLAGALTSALVMALLFQPGSDPSRVYYGSDTRAAGFLVGAALALVWQPGKLPHLNRVEGQLLAFAGLLGLLNLAWFCWQVNAYQAALFRGGLLWVALATAVVIAALVPPQRVSPLAQVLGNPLLRYIGLRSYSIYLWHWPVYALTRPHLDQPLAGLPLLAVRLITTVALAELSFQLVEQPFRHGLLQRSWANLRVAYTDRHWDALVGWASGISTTAAFIITLSWLVLIAHPATPPPYVAASAFGAARTTAVATPTNLPVQPTITRTAAPTQLLATSAPPTAVPMPTPVPPRHVLAIGDSVMLGAAAAMSNGYDTIEVDAAVSRQAQTGSEILAARRDAGTLGDVVVVQLGNNGPLDRQQFDEMLTTLQAVPRVLVLTVRVPRPWESPNNEIIRASVVQHPNAVVLDWYAASAENYGYFWDDGLHLRPEGAAAYASLILRNLQ